MTLKNKEKPGGDVPTTMPEFARAGGIQQLFGIKRGSLYNLVAAGKIRSSLVMGRGRKSGMRLFDVESVRAYIQSQSQTPAEIRETFNH